MTTLLPRLLNEYGVVGTAQLLGIDRNTIWIWGKRIKLRRECRYVVDLAKETTAAGAR